ncbi:hypothetical protein Bcav_4103 [Beutenbergia cavernae DSM 12333]|uniref:Uncharacterized protein n=1 Tax=Beutenbergia cavernae (strain ATCC BAA-8 / DSM 12333 / CCUG 43141 / JCM 11478 / NBRC 16432 / NCIMB 13614 / HKI 0122) TaxID=471853 RepID=C5C5Y6_BEUC1|nr:DUF6463 family protein [Beutenbergia cavernae]ACQ82344.1 hypothetical protein Bcav_4103 [Beutenbergia cavernae DSM 12333]
MPEPTLTPTAHAATLPGSAHPTNDVAPGTPARSPHPGRGLTRAAGIALIVIATAHVVGTMTSAWSGWLAGNLRDGTADPESVATFWAQPGGLAVPLALVGLLVIRMARRSERAPTYLGWVLLGWIVLCMTLIGPASGFTSGLVPSVLLIAADLRARRSPAAPVAPAPGGRP